MPSALIEQKERFAQLIVAEAGKPVRTARIEVERAILTFKTAAEEAIRLGGESIPLDLTEGNEGRWGLVQRFPVGPVLAITPFNFPLMLVAHKLAPAIAAGCPVVLKPAPQTPFTALALGEVILKAGWPEEALAVLPLANEDTAWLAEREDRLKMVSFTGSATVGWGLKAKAGKKRVALELGGNAAMILHSDWRGPDMDLDQTLDAVAQPRGAWGVWLCGAELHHRAAGVCGAADFPDVFVEAGGSGGEDGARESSGRGDGDWASDTAGGRGPDRELGAGGDRCRREAGGGRRAGCWSTSLLQPTILTGTKPGMKVHDEEIFGPVVAVEPYDDFEEALAMVNRSKYGLQAGLFTRDAGRIMTAYRELEVGAVIVGDTPTWRLDPMPYGGVKDSGLGREGVRWAIEEMTEPRMLVMTGM